MSLRLRALAGLAGAVLLVGLGCNKKTDTGTTPPPTATTNQNTATASTGETLYQQHCVKCHRQGGKKSAPDLSKLSSDPSRTAEWIADHIKDPTIHSPESRMPKFADKLSADQMRKLAEYILSLKS